MPFQDSAVTVLPNHWWASSCAMRRSSASPAMAMLRPNVDMPIDSSGISSSSSVTTTLYESSGYGPNSFSNSSIISRWRAKDSENSRRRSAGM